MTTDRALAQSHNNVQKGRRRIALIPGDGVGLEVVPAAERVLAALGLGLEFVRLDAGWETFRREGNALPEATLAALRQCDGALFGAVSSLTNARQAIQPDSGDASALDLYGNLRPSPPLVDGCAQRRPADRAENTECLYVKQERLEQDGRRAVAGRVITAEASQRIARLAFEQARLRREARDGVGRSLVTVVHKANVINRERRPVREACLAVAQAYPDVEVEEQLVDSMAYRLVREPQRYDVVVAPNLRRHPERRGGGADGRRGHRA